MNLIKRDTPNLFTYLRKAGYYVCWLGKNDMLDTDSFQDSVDICYDKMYDSGCGRDIFSDQGECNFMQSPMECSVEGTRDYKLITAGVDFIEQYSQDKPFVLYLPLGIPHVPFTVPEPFYSMYHENDIPYLRPPNLPYEPVFRKIAR